MTDEDDEVFEESNQNGDAGEEVMEVPIVPEGGENQRLTHDATGNILWTVSSADELPTEIQFRHCPAQVDEDGEPVAGPSQGHGEGEPSGCRSTRYTRRRRQGVGEEVQTLSQGTQVDASRDCIIGKHSIK